MQMTSPSSAAITAMEKLVKRGPITIVLVFSTTCPHCQTYMPLWHDLERTKNRRANLVSMQASTYDKMPLSSQKPVTSVPTVLFVNKSGQISEASAPRSMSVMKNAVTMGVDEETASTTSASNDYTNTIQTLSPNIFKRTMSRKPNWSNQLEPLPATPVSSSIEQEQTGRSPWAAFVSAARQAAPVAALLGAYAVSRSSGLGAPTTAHRRRRSTQKRRTRRTNRTTSQKNHQNQ
jgi:thiol-disulfide isomerase/thioredoxin